MSASERESNGKTLHMHFRCPARMRARLDEIVGRLQAKGTRTTRSQVARMILLEHMGDDDPVTTQVEECIHTMYGAMEEAFGRLLQNTQNELRTYLADAISKPGRSDPGFPRRRRRTEADLNG